MATRTKAVWQNGDLMVVPFDAKDQAREDARRDQAAKDAEWLKQNFKPGDLVDFIDWTGTPRQERIVRLSSGLFPDIEDCVSMPGGKAQSRYFASEVRQSFKVVK